MSREFESLRKHAYFGEKSVLDTYGAKSPAEFFAVATESFFEEPDALAMEYPDLYGELQKYFQVDPRQWKPAPLPEKQPKTEVVESKDKVTATETISTKSRNKEKRKSRASATDNSATKSETDAADNSPDSTDDDVKPVNSANSANPATLDAKGNPVTRAANIQREK